MHFSSIIPFALLLAPLAAAQFEIRVREANPDNTHLSTQSNALNEREAYGDSQFTRRSPVYTHDHIQQLEDHKEAEQVRHDQEAQHLDQLHASGASAAQIAAQHTHMQGIAQGIADTRWEINENHPDGRDAGHHGAVQHWAKIAKAHGEFAKHV